LCQKRTNALQQKAPQFDHLVGEREQFVWNLARAPFEIYWFGRSAEAVAMYFE